MSLSAELERLADLQQRGVLSEPEFQRAKERVLGGTQRAAAPAVSALNALRRSRTDRWLGGVCGGLAQSSGLASWLWRLLFALLMLCAGSGLLVYVLMWILLPQDDAPIDDGHGQFHPV